MMPDGDRSLAVFIDFENLALGFQGRRERFDIARVLERLVEKGKIVAKKAYADWSRFAPYTAPLHEAAIELVEIPRRAQSGKNSADIRLCVDAMDLAYSKEHIDTFVVVSGDSDFSPLVSKLKENGKHVIGLGMQESTSELLRDNCDEFIYYEDLGKHTTMAPNLSPQLPETKRKAFALLLESLLALRRENKEVLWSSMVKDTMKRKKPSFNENYHGYRTFSELLEDAQREGVLELETDKRSRTYVVTRFGSEMTSPAASLPSKAPVRRRRSARGRSSGEKPRRMLVEIPSSPKKGEAEPARTDGETGPAGATPSSIEDADLPSDDLP
ncbi:MAG TPA: NYN domain-containing protein [Gemmataceae bacterium]|nr:NYN domain-containing protein [Gemmataceae bacterium]